MALIAYFAPGERIDRYRKTVLALILLGALVIVGWYAVVTGGSDWGSWRNVGQILFLAAAFVVVMRAAELAPLQAAAVVSITSLVAYLPF